VNVTVESLAPCKKLVRVEIESQKVDATFEEITKDFQHHARLPGFRPGKAPRDMVARLYDKDIRDEVKRKLISDSYKTAMDEQKLDVLGQPDIEEIQFNRGQAMLFAATVETAPEFQLPEYLGLTVKREVKSVTPEDEEKALDMLRQPRASYKDVSRPIQGGDFAVVNYTGTCDGQPIREIAPGATRLTEQKDFWLAIESGWFIPGFTEQLVGASAGEKRSVTVDFPADFVEAALAGKKGVYEVQVTGVKEKVLPALDDEFAKSYGAENIEKLRAGVRKDLENELQFSQSKSIRNQLVRSIVERVNFELPESALANETRNVVYELVQENSKRGVSRQVIEQQKDQIYTAASQGARGRLMVAFLLQKIAEKENIKVSDSELSARIVRLAQTYDIPPERFAKDLRKRNGLIEIYDQIMNEKVLDLMQKSAKIEDVVPGAQMPAIPAAAAESTPAAPAAEPGSAPAQP
jgi:trigger factor